ncbi:hypothetical protein [Erythrobacter westpacificensis]|uniref:hypothetical protein n=1 Tax=Erythrobacter westpacificensis TaxID=1055231 RepID=UPI0031F78B32
MEAVNPDSKADPMVCLIEAALFARMAAAHGETQDQGHFISITSMMCMLEGEDSTCAPVAEAIARLAIAADAGSDYASDMLPGLAEQMTPELMAQAKELQRQITGENQC